MKCQLCNSDLPEKFIVCGECGCNFEKKENTDKNKVQSYLDKLKLDCGWAKKVRAIKRIHDILLTKYSDNEWSLRDTEKFLGISKTTISDNIKLSICLDKNPKLSSLENITKAKRFCKESSNGSIKTEYELQKYIFNNWEKIPFFKEWSLLKKRNANDGKYYTGEVGEIDLLVQHRTKNQLLVVELKIEKTSDVSVGQILRYIGWVKEKIAKKEKEVYGLIISRILDKSTKYALKCVPFIYHKIYYCDKNDNLHFFNSDKNYTFFDDLIREFPEGELDLIKNFSEKTFRIEFPQK